MNTTTKLNDKLKHKPHSEDSVPSFIRKTYEILEEGKYSDVIRWSEDGTSIVITNPTEFAQKVLPAYFKHNNLTSFIRQLNMYDFHKKRTLNMDHVYCHELFQRGKKHLLKEIRRKNSESIPPSNIKLMPNMENVQSKQDLEAVVHENVLLKRLNQEALGRASLMETKLKEISVENQALWAQIYQLKEKESLLKAVIINFAKQNGSVLASLPPFIQNELDFANINQKDPKDNSPTFTAQTTTKSLFVPQNNFQSAKDLRNNASQMLSQSDRNLVAQGDNNYQLLAFNPNINPQLFEGWNVNLESLKPMLQNNDMSNRGFVDDGNGQIFSTLGKRRMEPMDKDDLETYTKKLKQNATVYNDLNNKLVSQNMTNLPNKENQSLAFNLMNNSNLAVKEEGNRKKTQ